MKWKTTIILLVIAAGVYAYLYFIERNRPNTEDAARQAQNVVNLSREKIDGIVIQNGDERSTSAAAGRNGVWKRRSKIRRTPRS